MYPVMNVLNHVPQLVEVVCIGGVRWLLKFAKTITLTLYGFTRSEQHSTVQNQFETHRWYIDAH
mgnify:CR=1 FL=1